ncbi:MAG: hypothetical protein K6C97_08190 [Treponema sp.]|nr:hypothetical protein [Treponema sp.]
MEKIKSQQILIPKKVYIGDTAELRCSFNSSELKFMQLTINGGVELNTEVFTQALDNRDFEILKLQLTPAGVNYYQLSISFKAWKTGDIQFPSIKVGDTELSFDPVNIVSITEQNKVSSLKENMDPLLLPGTTYKLYGALIIFIVLLILGIRIIVKRKKIMFFIHNQQLLHKYRKNKKASIKKLNTLINDEDLALSDCDFAQAYQHILRNYLETRFDFPFTRASTSEFSKGFYEVTKHLLSEDKENAFSEIVSSFVRSDFIRYSRDASFKKNEKEKMIESAIKNIERLERIEKEDKDTKGEANA